MSKQDRQSNIELLRILSIWGVIILHYNNKSIGGGLKYTEVGGINWLILVVLESVAICAVDLFMLISGFFSCKGKKATIQKPIELVFQVILFSFIYNLIVGLVKGNLTIKSLVGSLIPANYFVILYIVVYLLHPYLNLIFEKITNRFMIVLLIIFSLYPTLVDIFNQVSGREWLGLSTIGMYGSQWGYTIVNFIVMYFIGMYIRKNFENLSMMKMKFLIWTLLAIVLLITIWACISDIRYANIRNLAWIYSNPLVIIEAVVIFLIFSKIHIGRVGIINKLSAATFTVFLSHGYFITHINIRWAVQQKPIIMLAHILLSIIMIYLICFLIHFVYDNISNVIFKKIREKEIIIAQI